jgi:uncharacterized protein (DUF302 family)
MKYIQESKKSVVQAAEDLEAAVKKNGFGVLHVYDLKATLKSKGVDLAEECQIFEVCNPVQAAQVLSSDMSLNMALPCRISVYQDGDATKIGTILPTRLLGLLSDDESLRATAEQVESAIKHMIDDAV